MLEQKNLMERYARIMKQEQQIKDKLNKIVDKPKQTKREQNVKKLKLRKYCIKQKKIKLLAIEKEQKIKDKLSKKEQQIKDKLLKKEQKIKDKISKKEQQIKDKLSKKEEKSKDKLLKKEEKSKDKLLKKESEKKIKKVCKKEKKIKPIKELKLISDITEYKNQVLSLTEKTKSKFFKDLKKYGYEFDHKITIWFGFHNNIKPSLIANYKNLQYIPKEENRFKSYYSLVDNTNKCILESIIINSDFLNTLLDENYDRTIDYSLVVHKFKKQFRIRK
jgi:hypothetical protein